MSSKNCNFKKLLAAICGVTSALGGNAASAKGSVVKTVTMGSNDKPAGPTKNTAVNKGNSILSSAKEHPIKFGVIAGGGVGLIIVTGLIINWVLKGNEKPNDDPSGGQKPPQGLPPLEPPLELPLQQKPDANTPIMPDPNTQPPQQNVDKFAFDQVKIRNFRKRVFYAEDKNGNGGLVGISDNDAARDLRFLIKLRDAGIKESLDSFAAFTSNDRDTTIYVVDAPANSPIRDAFLNCNNGKGVPDMIWDSDNYPNLLFFVGRKGVLSGTNWLSSTLHVYGLADQGMIAFYNKSTELR